MAFDTPVVEHCLEQKKRAPGDHNGGIDHFGYSYMTLDVITADTTWATLPTPSYC